MKHFLLFVLSGFLTLSAFGQNDFRTRQDGDWEDAQTWEEFNGTSWQNTANVPDAGAGNIRIENFTSVTINSNVSVDELVIGEDAFLTVTSGASLTIEDGPGTDMEVTVGDGVSVFDGYFTLDAGATLINRGEIISSASNTSLSGSYQHDRDGGSIPNAGWATGSELRITGADLNGPSNMNGPFYDVVWDAAGQTAANITMNGDLGTITNDLIIENTNGQFVDLNAGGSPSSLTIGNNLVIRPNAGLVLSQLAAFDVQVNGMLQNEGALLISGATGNGTLRVAGDVTSSGTFGTTAASVLEFNGTDQTIDASITGDVAYVVASGTVLRLGESVLGGNGSFTTDTNVSLFLGSLDANGALQTGAGGNIQVPDPDRTWGNGTTITYNGSARQYIADGHPSNVPMIIQNPQGAELVTDLTMNEDITLNGALYLNDNALTVAGDLTAAGGFYVYPTANSSLYFTGIGGVGNFPFPPTPQVINNLQLDRNGPGGLNLVTDLTVKGNLILDQGTFDISGHQLEIEGDVQTTNGRLRTDMMSELTISGSGALGSIDFADATSQLNAITLARSGATFTPSDELVIFEKLELLNGTFNNNSDRLLILNGSEIVRHSNAQLTGVHPRLFSGTYDLKYIGGSMTAGVELPGAGIDELGDLTIEGGPVTIANDLIINGDVALTSGGIFAPNVNFTMRGSSWHQELGSFSNTDGRVTFESVTAVTADDLATFHHIRVSATGDVTFADVRLNGDLDINSAAASAFNGMIQLAGSTDQALNVQGAALNDIMMNKNSGEVNITSALNLYGKLSYIFPATINTNDNLVVKAGTDALNGGSIQIIPPGSVINGDVTVERLQKDVVPTGIEVFLGSAIANAPVSQLQDDFNVYGSFTGASPGPNTPSMFAYDETQPGDQFNGFTPYPVTANTEILEPGKGYRANVEGNGDIIIDLTGSVNQGQVAIPVTYTDNGMSGADGWNLVANPYPAPIGWDQVGGWDKAVVNNTIVLEMDGRYLYWNGTGAGNSSRSVITNGVIPAGYTFWVQANASGDLLIEESAKIDAASPPSIADPSDQLIISLERGAEFDEAVVVVWPDATKGYDAGLDAVKLDNSGFDLSTKAEDGTPLALNYIAPFGCQETIDIALNDVTNGTYTISFSELTSFTYPYDITLSDAFLGTDIDIRSQNSYDFTVDEGDAATFTDRFRLTLSIDLAVLVNTTIDLQSDDFICEGSDATVIMNTSQPGITYQAYLNNVAYGDPFNGTGQTVIIDIPDADLSNENTFRIAATAPDCGGEIDLLETLTITRTILTPQIVQAGADLVSNYPNGNEWFFGGVLISTADRITPTADGTYTLVVTLNGCQASAERDYQVVASVDEVFSEAITIAPNPASEQLRVYLPDDARGEVYFDMISLAGSIVKSGRINLEQTTLDISDIRPGVYLLKIITEEKTGVKKVLIR